MINPVLRIRLPIQRCALYIYRLVARIKIHVADYGCFVGDGAGNTHAFEERRDDEVDVLPRVREQPHHGEGDEGAHGTAVVVAGQACRRGREEGWNIEVGAQRRESWTPCVVVLEYGEEGWLVAYVGDVVVVEIVEA